ncbi:MAG: hypothetical protein ACKVX7_15715 [Planctomycetota bacterium]
MSIRRSVMFLLLAGWMFAMGHIVVGQAPPAEPKPVPIPPVNKPEPAKPETLKPGNGAPPAAEKKTPGTADPETAKLLDKMDELSYMAARKGLKKATLKGTFKTEAMGTSSEGAFDYAWDGQAGKLSFANAADRGSAARAGLEAKKLEEHFRDTRWPDQFSGCKLSSVLVDGKTKIVCEGDQLDGIKSVTLNAQGLPASLEMNFKKAGPPTAGLMTTEFAEHEGQYVLKKQVINIAIQGMGTIAVTVENEYAVVGKYYVPVKETMVSRMGEQQMSSSVFTYSDYKFDDEVQLP